MEYYVLFGEKWEPKIHEIIKVRGKFYHALLTNLYQSVDLYKKEFVIKKESSIYFRHEWVRLESYVMTKDFVENYVDMLMKFIQNEQISELVDFLTDSAHNEKDQVYVIETEFEISKKEKYGEEIDISMTLTDGTYNVNLGGVEYVDIDTVVIAFESISLNELLNVKTLEDIEDFGIEWISIPHPEEEFVQYEIHGEKLNVLLLNKFKDLKRFNTFKDMLLTLAPEGVPVEL